MIKSPILLCFIGVKFIIVRMDCVGYFKFPPCCIGERLDEETQKCADCPSGLLGINCTLMCSIPFSGHRCSLGSCNCTRTSCNRPADLCSSSPVDNATLMGTIDVDEETKTAVDTPSDTRNKGNDDEFNFVVYIGPLLVTLIFILVIFLFLRKKYRPSWNCLKWRRHGSYEAPIRVYENRTSTNLYDFPEVNISETQRSSDHEARMDTDHTNQKETEVRNTN